MVIYYLIIKGGSLPMKWRVLKEYRINEFTMAIVPEPLSGGRVISKVYEVRDVFYVPYRPIDVVENSCLYYGASLLGRKEGTKEITGIRHKSPVAICPLNHLFFFPTMAYNQKMCAWFSHRHIARILPFENKKTVVYLGKKTKLLVPMTHYILENQLYRTAQLRSAFENREVKVKARNFLEIDKLEICEESINYQDISVADEDEDDPSRFFVRS